MAAAAAPAQAGPRPRPRGFRKRRRPLAAAPGRAWNWRQRIPARGPPPVSSTPAGPGGPASGPRRACIYGDGGFDAGDWSGYTSLKFGARSLLGGTAHLKLRIDDAAGRRAVRILAVSADTVTTCAVSIAGLRGEIDTRRVRLLDLYMRQPSRDHSLLIDDIRLEAGPLELLELEGGPRSPGFGGGCGSPRNSTAGPR